MKIKRYLVVRSNGDCLVRKTATGLHRDEVAFPLEVTIPDVWGRLRNDMAIRLVLPDPDPALIAVGEPEVATFPLQAVGGDDAP